MKSHVFRVVLEQDKDVWRAYVPQLETKGASTWGSSKDEALKNIHDVVQMVIEDLLETGEGLPVPIAQAEHPVVAVNVE